MQGRQLCQKHFGNFYLLETTLKGENLLPKPSLTRKVNGKLSQTVVVFSKNCRKINQVFTFPLTKCKCKLKNVVFLYVKFSFCLPIHYSLLFLFLGSIWMADTFDKSSKYLNLLHMKLHLLVRGMCVCVCVCLVRE